MSLESVKAFMDRMDSDKEFAKKLFACKDADAQRAFVQDAGYSFTREEFNQLVELSDEQLEMVAGGHDCYLCGE
jgi:predicted ribosomally synthesized peptide with nif11-like leader